MRSKCVGCGFLTTCGEYCLYCRIEMSGKHVGATLGPPIDGFNHISHATHSYKRLHGTYHMSFADNMAIGKVKTLQ